MAISTTSMSVSELKYFQERALSRDNYDRELLQRQIYEKYFTAAELNVSPYNFGVGKEPINDPKLVLLLEDI